MSRNFELLRRAGRAQALFEAPVVLPQGVEEELVTLSEKLRRDDVAQPEPQHQPVDLAPTDIGYAELTKLVRRVFMFSNSHAPHVVAFSSITGSGSGEICLQAGEVLAAQGCGTVCLVDANLHSPSLHQLAGVGRSPGLTDAMNEPRKIDHYARRLGNGNLWIVPAGPPPVEGAAFASDRMRARLHELTNQFDFILLDAPSGDSHTDAVLIGQMSDGLVLVLEANSTRRETARTVKDVLEAANVKILGAILNNRTFPIPASIYHRL